MKDLTAPQLRVLDELSGGYGFRKPQAWFYMTCRAPRVSLKILLKLGYVRHPVQGEIEDHHSPFSDWYLITSPGQQVLNNHIGVPR